MVTDDADDLVPFLDVRAIKQRPVVAVLTALGVGYVVARLVSHGGGDPWGIRTVLVLVLSGRL